MPFPSSFPAPRACAVAVTLALSSGVCPPRASVTRPTRRVFLAQLAISFLFPSLSFSGVRGELATSTSTACSVVTDAAGLPPSSRTHPPSLFPSAFERSEDLKLSLEAAALSQTERFASRASLSVSPFLRHLLLFRSLHLSFLSASPLLSPPSAPASLRRSVSSAEQTGSATTDGRVPRAGGRDLTWGSSASLPFQSPSVPDPSGAPLLYFATNERSPEASYREKEEKDEKIEEKREARREDEESEEEINFDTRSLEGEDGHDVTASAERQQRGTMAWRCSGSSNDELVDNLRASKIIRDKRVYDTMKSIDRGNFIDVCPYADMPQPLGVSSATISAPHMHASALEALKDHLVPGNRALDVGSGSGYLTACMARMVGVRGAGSSPYPDTPEGVAVGIECLPDLVKYSINKVKAAYPDLLANPHFRLRVGDGWKGYPEDGPYDAIHVGAAASAIPKELLAQLAFGGKMVVPVETTADGRVLFEGVGENETDRQPRGRGWLSEPNQVFVEVTKDSEGNVRVKKLMGVMYVPLVKQSSTQGER